ILGRDHQLWRQGNNRAGRTLIDTAVNSFQAIDDNIVVVLGSDGKLWRETGTKEHRELIASGVASFHEIAGTTYVLTATDHVLWRKPGNDKPEQVDAQVGWFQPIDMHLVYILGQDGRLWRELGDKTHRELVDTDVMQ